MKTVSRLIIFALIMLPAFINARDKKENQMSGKAEHQTKKIISTQKSPKAIGPYNQGIVAGGFLFTSGQLPMNPKTGEIASSIEVQTKQVLDNLKAIIEAAGSSMENVVKCTVYLKNMNDFDAVNKIYSTYFQNNPPARVCVEVSKMAKNALVEIDAIAFID